MNSLTCPCPRGMMTPRKTILDRRTLLLKRWKFLRLSILIYLLLHHLHCNHWLKGCISKEPSALTLRKSNTLRILLMFSKARNMKLSGNLKLRLTANKELISTSTLMVFIQQWPLSEPPKVYALRHSLTKNGKWVVGWKTASVCSLTSPLDTLPTQEIMTMEALIAIRVMGPHSGCLS